jgi:amino acid transporter
MSNSTNNDPQVSSSLFKDIATDEKHIPEVTVPGDKQEGIIIDAGLRRGLLGRHVSLISLASVIGASCFYGFGYALYLSGPLGAFIGFGIVGERDIGNKLMEVLLNIAQGFPFGL